MFEQLSLFDLIKSKPIVKPGVLKVGDKIGRVVLGECRIATITEVEGLPYYPFYRTDSGCCYSYKEGLNNIQDLMQQAEENRNNYETIIPINLEERLTVEYPPRKSDGKVLWAQIGIFQGMLFWKESMTYQFLERCKDQKDLQKKYQRHRKNILSDLGKTAPVIVDEEKTMRRLYKSKAANGYADAEYVQFNY